ncbi:MAG: phage holin family protein [Pseudomonadota bacterium]|nr:phage holin family protein [Pseudomonadota bacterium]
MEEEISRFSSSVAIRVALYAGAGVLSLLGLIFIGVALLLVAALPTDEHRATWALVVVPLAPFVLSAICVVVARMEPVEPGFETLKTQIDEDLAMLKEVTQP